MQVTRDERLAKLQALSIVAVMALVAIAVHFWPRESAVVMTARPIVAARSPVAPERQPAARAPRRVSARTPRPVPRPVAAFEPASGEQPRVSGSLSGPALASLPALPGTPLALGSDLDLLGMKNRDLPPASGAVTRAMQTTGKSLAGALKKTGSAFRRSF